MEEGKRRYSRGTMKKKKSKQITDCPWLYDSLCLLIAVQSRNCYAQSMENSKDLAYV